jgi:endonuclease G
MNLARIATTLSLLFCSLLALAAPATQCPAVYLDGRAPEITNTKLASGIRELCFEAFGVMHSAVTRTPLWSAEHLTRSSVQEAQEQSRENSFHAEASLPFGARAELKDYARSGFDRGHMSPNGDMPDRQSQFDSFSLANMVPQNPVNNRYVWASIEHAVRTLAKREGDLYVITGPAFIGGSVQKVGNVLVPTHLYKVVYSPKRHAAAAYFIANTSTAQYQIVSIAQLEPIVGIDLLPSLSAREKAELLALPQPRSRARGD